MSKDKKSSKHKKKETQDSDSTNGNGLNKLKKHAEKIIEYLKERGAYGKKTILKISDAIEQSPKYTSKVLDFIKKEGVYNIRATKHKKKEIYFDLEESVYPLPPLKVDSKYFPEGIVKFGAIANTEMGNKYHRDDALHSYYELLSDMGVKLVLMCGDLLAGPPNKKNRPELMWYDYESQSEYFIENFPRKKGITTMFITSKYREGEFISKQKVDIGAYIQRLAKENKREDLVYVGHIKRDLIMDVEGKDIMVRMSHLIGNIPYAKSYPMQKMIESIQGGTKPKVFLAGHLYHLEHMFHREVWGVQVGSFMDQTPSMLNAMQGTAVGGQIITLQRPTEEEIHEQKFPEDQVKLEAQVAVYFNREYYTKKLHGVKKS